ncbi:MAG: CHRD domain-containing protein [Rhodospirillaceae bacterium]
MVWQLTRFIHKTSMLFGGMLMTLFASLPAQSEDAWGGIRLFEADLSADHQTILTQSEGAGFAKVRFDLNTMEISWEVEYENLTSPPTGITLHGPAQPGTNAVAIIDLGINGLESPITGSLKVSDSHVQYMLLGWTYVLLKTENYDHGELRGKLDTVPPPGFKKTKYD